MSSVLKVYQWQKTDRSKTVYKAQQLCVMRDVPMWAVKNVSGEHNNYNIVETLISREFTKEETKIAYKTTSTHEWDNVKIIKLKNTGTDIETTCNGCWQKVLFSPTEIDNANNLFKEKYHNSYLKVPLPIFVALAATKAENISGIRLAVTSKIQLKNDERHNMNIGHVEMGSAANNRQHFLGNFTKLAYVQNEGRNSIPDLWG
jgi:hypothetical protein